jgi:hypothetical protein
LKNEQSPSLTSPVSAWSMSARSPATNAEALATETVAVSFVASCERSGCAAASNDPPEQTASWIVPMAKTGPPCVLTRMVPDAAAAPAPRRTTPLGTVIVAETEYVPAASVTTWFFPRHPFKALWIAVVASPACDGTLAHVVVRTGRPSGPSALPVGVSARMPGFQAVV